MNLKRTVIIGVSGGALAVWIAAAATSPARPAPLAPTAGSTAVDASGAELATEIARLHERLRPTTQPMQARDLFRYAMKTPVQSLRPFNIAPPEPAMPAAHGLRLVGIAEDAGAAGPIRTAIISIPGGVSLVKEGDLVLRQYQVTKVSADAVDLLDAASGVALHLPLP